MSPNRTAVALAVSALLKERTRRVITTGTTEGAVR